MIVADFRVILRIPLQRTRLMTHFVVSEHPYALLPRWYQQLGYNMNREEWERISEYTPLYSLLYS